MKRITFHALGTRPEISSQFITAAMIEQLQCYLECHQETPEEDVDVDGTLED